MTLGEILKVAGIEARCWPVPAFGQADPSTEVYVNGAPVRKAYMVRLTTDEPRTVVNRLCLEYGFEAVGE